MSRQFETRIVQARQQLKSKRLVRVRSVRPHDAPAAFAQGYKKHRAKNSDTFLTDAGFRHAEALLRKVGRMAEVGSATCANYAEPTGPVASDEAGCT